MEILRDAESFAEELKAGNDSTGAHGLWILFHFTTNFADAFHKYFIEFHSNKKLFLNALHNGKTYFRRHLRCKSCFKKWR